MNKINLAIKDKKEKFQDIADQCNYFYSGGVDFMYSQKYRNKYLKGSIQPKFQICLQKAFEFVAVIGPLVYNRNPNRNCRPYNPTEFTPADFGDPNDPNVVQIYQQEMMREQLRSSRNKTRCGLVEKYLNYTAREQPRDGLKQAGEDAVTEALVKGRGLLWPTIYSRPGSENRITTLEYDSVDNLLIDPDATSAVFGEAQWIARKHVTPHWIVERLYDLPFGTLRNKPGNSQMSETQAANKGNPPNGLHTGKTFDLCTWWEIWSLGGVGTRLTGVSKVLESAFDEIVGDYAYIAVCNGYPSPLNAPKGVLEEATEEEVAEMFAWPIPTWADSRWPVAMLDFYRNIGSAWPIPPIAPGLGELTAMNIIFSALVNKAWNSSREVIAILKSAQADVESVLKSGDEQLILAIPNIHQDINKVISYLGQPDIKADMWHILDYLFGLFDKRVGLADLLYGMTGPSMDRTATGVRTKDEKLSIRPDHMATKVEEWLTEASQLEKLFAYFGGIEGQDVKALLGDAGAYLWDQHFANADKDVIIGETDCTIEVGSARKPNKQRDQSNMQQIYPALSQQLDKYADMTTDSGPLNELNRLFGESIEQDMSGLQMGPRQPPPPPPDQPDPELQQKEFEFEQDARHTEAKHLQDLEIKQEVSDQDLDQDTEKHDLDMEKEEDKLDMARQQAAAKGSNNG